MLCKAMSCCVGPGTDAYMKECSGSLVVNLACFEHRFETQCSTTLTSNKSVLLRGVGDVFGTCLRRFWEIFES